MCTSERHAAAMFQACGVPSQWSYRTKPQLAFLENGGGVRSVLLITGVRAQDQQLVCVAWLLAS